VNTTAVASGDIFQVIYDADNLKVWMGINNTYYGISSGSTVTVSASDIANGTNPAYTLSSSKRYHFGGCVDNSTDGFSANFGQRPFAYTAPSGFKALCTQNLPTPDVVQGDTAFNAVLYTGTGADQSITGVGFQPDFVWIKRRSSPTTNHCLYDAVRGATKRVYSNLTNAEDTDASSLTSFDADGFSLGSDSGTNLNASTNVAWNWKANGAGSSNTDGSITSTVSANTTAGISIVAYTSNGTNSSATVGHGLGIAPEVIITKDRDTGSTNWPVYHKSLTANGGVQLNQTNAYTSNSSYWNNTNPTSSVFSIGSFSNINSDKMIAYCFAPVEGFSAFGKYTGNGSDDGPFIYLGFRPRFVMWKRTDSTGDWIIVDGVRNTYNTANLNLYPMSSDAEGNGYTLDLLSNGFKPRLYGSSSNASGGTYVYMAFAESPFKYSLAR
jgi:hypothetical protein